MPRAARLINGAARGFAPITQREEISRLKGLKGRPDSKPSGMDKGTEPANPTKQGPHPRRGKVRPRVNALAARQSLLSGFA